MSKKGREAIKLEPLLPEEDSEEKGRLHGWTSFLESEWFEPHMPKLWAPTQGIQAPFVVWKLVRLTRVLWEA